MPLAATGLDLFARHSDEQMGENNNEEDKEVFIKDDRHVWIAAVVVEKSKSEVVCRTCNGDKRTIKLKEFRKEELPRRNAEMVADLIDMKYLHEPGVLVNLISRHEEGKPYTRSRDVLISINPCRWLHQLYSETNQIFYAKRLVWQISESDPRQGLEPHIYEVSALAYAEMAYQRRNQSIIITGESGSGKTEAAKLMMHHIASIQCGYENKIGLSLQKSASSAASFNLFSAVVDRILNTNPILEAFGNAMTAQNENSSRFGKHVQLQFDNFDSLSEQLLQEKRNAILVGSYCDVYLLETSRVCIHASNERTYHIFYQLLAASDGQKSSIWNGIKGKSAADFKYVGIPVTNMIDGKNDSIKFEETLSALSHVGIPQCDIFLLMQALCIVLQLGNVDFEADPVSDDRAVLTTTLEFSDLSNLLGVNSDELLLAFTQRIMITRKETFKVPLSTSSVSEARDALAKDVYLNAFNWLTSTINSVTRAETNTIASQLRKELGIIGLLDIFGFESFTTNRFEQLCINYANEKLQQKAIRDIFSVVREEYEYEGISLDLVEVVSNEQLLNLFDGRSGLIALLNEESYRPKGNSKAFTAKVFESFKSSPLIIRPKAGVTNQFGIIHYAGTVIYTTENFLIGNQDTLPTGLKSCVSKSKNPIAAGSQMFSWVDESEVSTIKESPKASRVSKLSPTKSLRPKILQLGSKTVSIGKKWELAQEKLKSRGVKVSNSKCASIAALDSSMVNPDPWKDLRSNKPTKALVAPSKLLEKQTSTSDLMAATVWTKYRAQLNSLVEKLNETHSRYVRCIKPNTTMNAKSSDRLMIANQLRYTGLVSTTTLSRAMFSNSIANKILLTKFRFLWDKKNFPSKAKRMDTNEIRRKLDCETLLQSTIKSFGCELVGSHGNKEIPYAVGKTKSYFRQGILEWLEFLRIRELQKAATLIQKHFRGRQSRVNMKRKTEAVSFIQLWFRKTKRLIASMKIQQMYRGYTARKELAKKTRRLIASMKIQKIYRGYTARKGLAKLKKHILVLQKYVRGLQTRDNQYIIKIAVTTIQCWYRQKRVLLRMKMWNGAKVLQKLYRGLSAKKRYIKTILAVYAIQKWWRRRNNRLLNKP